MYSMFSTAHSLSSFLVLFPLPSMGPVNKIAQLIIVTIIVLVIVVHLLVRYYLISIFSRHVVMERMKEKFPFYQLIFILYNMRAFNKLHIYITKLDFLDLAHMVTLGSQPILIRHGGRVSLRACACITIA